MGLHKKDVEGEESRIIDFGRQERHPPFADNSVKTSKYSLLSFFPLVSRRSRPPFAKLFALTNLTILLQIATSTIF